MKSIRKRLSFANIMSAVAVFIALSGIAVAAGLPKNSVGKKQLKNNAVTTAKIKKNAVSAAKIKKDAVTTAKIKNGAVDGNKLADNSVSTNKIVNGSVTGAKINTASTPFSQVVEKLRGTSSIPFTGSQVYPFNNATYTQPPGRDDQYLAGFDVTFAASCEQPRTAVAYLLKDAANPGSPGPGEIAGYALIIDKGSGTVTRRVDFGPSPAPPAAPMTSIAPSSPTNHTFSVLLLGSSCNSGSGVTATGAELDVIGTATS